MHRENAPIEGESECRGVSEPETTFSGEAIFPEIPLYFWNIALADGKLRWTALSRWPQRCQSDQDVPSHHGKS